MKIIILLQNASYSVFCAIYDTEPTDLNLMKMKTCSKLNSETKIHLSMNLALILKSQTLLHSCRAKIITLKIVRSVTDNNLVRLLFVFLRNMAVVFFEHISIEWNSRGREPWKWAKEDPTSQNLRGNARNKKTFFARQPSECACVFPVDIPLTTLD